MDVDPPGPAPPRRDGPPAPTTCARSATACAAGSACPSGARVLEECAAPDPAGEARDSPCQCTAVMELLRLRNATAPLPPLANGVEGRSPSKWTDVPSQGLLRPWDGATASEIAAVYNPRTMSYCNIDLPAGYEVRWDYYDYDYEYAGDPLLPAFRCGQRSSGGPGGPPPGQQEGVNNIIFVALPSRELTGGVPPSLAELVELQLLDLERNRLTELPDLPVRLAEVDIGRNFFRRLPRMHHLRELTVLRVNSNPMETLPALPSSLQELVADYAGIQEVPENFNLLTRLALLWLGGNQLRDLPAWPLEDLTRLTELDLSSNAIRELPRLPENLLYLYLRGNKLTEIPPLPAAMRYLDATYNELQSFPKLPADSDMTWLRMSNNFFIKELPSGIGNLAALQQLYVDHNSISVLATELGLLTSLTEIRLGQNRLESLPTEIGRLDSVEDFRAEDNRLTELPDVFGDLTNLDDLIVNGNALTDLPPSLAELKLKNPMFNIKVRPGNADLTDAEIRAAVDRLEGNGGKSLDAGLAAGLAIAGGIVLVLVILSGILLHRRRTRPVRPRGPPLPDPDTGLTPEETTFVYTDIQGSTSLWEDVPGDAMRAAMKAHDKALRNALVAAHGYLSATEGDSWFAAFHNPTDAAMFCCSAQQNLYEARWPEVLLGHPNASEDAAGMFVGLRVRMGMHSGAARVAQGVSSCGSTKEYSGRPIDVAREIGDAASGGSIVATAEVRAQICLNELERKFHGPVAVFSLGHYRFGLHPSGPRTNAFLPASERDRSDAAASSSVEHALVYLFPPELRQRGQRLLAQHSTLRRGVQLSPSCMDAPSGDVTLVFAKTSPALLAWADGENGQGVLDRAANFLATKCWALDGYVAESVPGVFYCAFEKAGAALQWAVEVQEGLMNLAWPEDIAGFPDCEELISQVNGDVVFRGPRFACGLASGRAEATVHPTTGRATYPSRLANRTARIASLAAPGQILASASTAVEGRADAGDKAPSWSAEELGEVELKGIAKAITIFAVTTPLLRERPMPSITTRHPSRASEAAPPRDVNAMFSSMRGDTVLDWDEELRISAEAGQEDSLRFAGLHLATLSDADFKTLVAQEAARRRMPPPRFSARALFGL